MLLPTSVLSSHAGGKAYEALAGIRHLSESETSLVARDDKVSQRDDVGAQRIKAYKLRERKCLSQHLRLDYALLGVLKVREENLHGGHLVSDKDNKRGWLPSSSTNQSPTNNPHTHTHTTHTHTHISGHSLLVPPPPLLLLPHLEGASDACLRAGVRVQGEHARAERPHTP